ncbi:hypothetical protein G3A39_41150 [Paraburkholderia aspalathi]|nr:hypothetical protein [Paraburkholderia aspalathi]
MSAHSKMGVEAPIDKALYSLATIDLGLLHPICNVCAKQPIWAAVGEMAIHPAADAQRHDPTPDGLHDYGLKVNMCSLSYA